MNEPYQCANCGLKAEYADLPDAKDMIDRHGPSAIYSDVECPKCGALCFPMDNDRQPTPGEITDGFGNFWSDKCHCGGNMSVVRPGKVQCEQCG